jgi:hypothetical protein
MSKIKDYFEASLVSILPTFYACFFANILSPNNYKAKTSLEKRCAKHFSMKNVGDIDPYTQKFFEKYVFVKKDQYFDPQIIV